LMKMLQEADTMLSTEELYEGVLSLKRCPTRQHLGVILASLPDVINEGEGLWRLKGEAPTDN
jgi:hypothetical protein